MPRFLSQLADKDKSVFQSAYNTQNELVGLLHELARELDQQAHDAQALLTTLRSVADAVNTIEKELEVSMDIVKKDIVSQHRTVFEFPGPHGTSNYYYFLTVATIYTPHLNS